MKNESPQPQRRNPAGSRRRQTSTAAAILSGKPPVLVTREDYFTPQWILLGLTLLTILLICFLFTPFTHQLDEIKNVILMFCPPMLLIGAVVMKDFSTMSWRSHGSSILLGLWFVSMIISFLLGDFKLVGERVIWFWAGCATFTVVFAWFLDSELKMRRAMLFWTLLGLASTIMGLFMYSGQSFTGRIYEWMKHDPQWQGSPWSTLFYTLTSSRSDFYSFVLNTDFYAAFLVMTIPIPLSMFFAEQKTAYRAISLISFLLMNVCLILTNSNDSFIAMLIAYPLYLFLCFRYVKGWNFSRRWLITFFACAIILAVEIALLMLPTIASTLAFKSAALEGRKVLWSGALWPWLYGMDRSRTHLDIMSIIFGVGPGGYRHYFPWFRRPDFFDQQINNVTTFSHDWYLDVGLEMGALGLFLFLWFFFRVMKDAIQQIRTTTSRTHLLYQVALVTGMVGIAIQNISSPNNRWAVAGMTFWALFGLSMGVYHLERPGEPSRESRDETAMRGLAVIGFIFAYGIVAWAGGNSTFAQILKLALAIGFVYYVFRAPKGRPMVIASQMAALIFALLFFERSTCDQSMKYWSAATKNATGLRYMEYAQSGELDQGKESQLLQMAQQQFIEAIVDNPTFATSYYKLGNVYNSLGDTEKAIKTYEDLNKMTPSYSEIYLNLGIMYYVKAKEVYQNIDDYRKLAEKKLAEANKARGEERQKLKDDAAQLNEAATTLESQAPEIRLKNLEKSFENLAEAARQSWKPNVQWYAAQQGEELASLYRHAGEQDKANAVDEQIKKYYETIINYVPKLEDLQVERKDKYPKAEEKLLTLAIRLEKLDDAEKVLKLMVSENPDRADYLNALLSLYDKRGKTQEKIAYLENAVHDNPMDSHLRAVLADAYDKAGDRQKYMAELRRIEVLDPNNTLALSGLYLANKANQEAARPYKEKLQHLGVNADDLTTIIREGVSTSSLAVPQQPKLSDSAVSADSSTATANSESTASTKAVTSATAAAAAPTAPAPATQTPVPGAKSSDAVSTAPDPETTAPATK